MYIYEKFFTVTKVHGYKIISIQRLASSLSPPCPNPPAPRQQHSTIESSLHPELSTQCCGKHDGDLQRTLQLPPSLPFCLLLEWGEQMNFSSFGKMFFWGMDKGVSFYSSRAGKDVRVTQTKTSLGKMGVLGLPWWRSSCLVLFKFRTPSSLKGASKLYSNSGDLFLRGFLGIPAGMEIQMRVCHRVTRGNLSRVVCTDVGSFLKNNFLGPDLDHHSPVGYLNFAILRPGMKKSSVMRTYLWGVEKQSGCH